MLQETCVRITCYFFQVAVLVGLVIMFATGVVTTYLQLILIAIIPPTLFLLFFLWLPESPYYLLKTGQRYKAIKTICWLQGDIPVVNGEMEANILEVIYFLYLCLRKWNQDFNLTVFIPVNTEFNFISQRYI